MVTDDAYMARRLHLLGEWDAALAVLDPDTEPELRAEIAVDRWFFRIEGHEEAEKAVAALDPASPAAHLLTARLAYSRLLFRRDPRPDDRAAAEAGYRAAAEGGDEKTRGWAEYHWAVLLDNIDEDPAGGGARREPRRASVEAGRGAAQAKAKKPEPRPPPHPAPPRETPPPTERAAPPPTDPPPAATPTG
ncbi:hypothetical protein ACFV23_29195, partial [Streptomyces sp. NPDC059627]